MLTPHQIELVKATVPVLQAHGVDLTKHFYARMLSKNPELRNVFNQAHQARGAQQQALAAAVLAYAQNIEHPENLLGAVKQIAQRHCSLGIRAEQYQIVGHHLIESIKEVLGAAATPELIDAWTAAYGMLADILIKAEQDIYNQQTAAQGGWSGWRPFECVNRVQESEDVVSFYFRPTDGGPVPNYLPGQYTTVRVFSKAMQIAQPRQYTLSQAAGSGMLRISVKLVLGTQGAPDGLVSSILHNRVKVGDVVELSAPTGGFALEDAKSEHPLVLIAAGIGITPMVPMLETLAVENPLRKVHFLYTTQNLAHYPLKKEVDAAISSPSRVRPTISVLTTMLPAVLRPPTSATSARIRMPTSSSAARSASCRMSPRPSRTSVLSRLASTRKCSVPARPINFPSTLSTQGCVC